MLDLLLRQQILIINLHIYATYPLAECTDCLVLNILLLFGGSPSDGRATEGRDVPDFPNCEVPDVGIAESFSSSQAVSVDPFVHPSQGSFWWLHENIHLPFSRTIFKHYRITRLRTSLYT